MSDLNQQDTAAQINWLSTTLSSAHEPWKIVVGHHPVYSNGPHGNTIELVHRFQPLFIRGNVNFYLSGHDHDLEYIQPVNESVHYVVSGGGSESYPIVSNVNAMFAQASPGFLVMTVYPSKANFYFFNENGEMLYRKQVNK